MLELIAIAIILVGIFLIIYGLFENVEYREVKDERTIRWGEEEFLEPYEEDFERKKKKTKVTGGGVVLIGPIPIVFGESRFAVIALILAIVLMLLSIGLMYVLPHYPHIV